MPKMLGHYKLSEVCAVKIVAILLVGLRISVCNFYIFIQFG
jgi:hypothetical protein